jgi:Tol biopolymer transport system component
VRNRRLMGCIFVVAVLLGCWTCFFVPYSLHIYDYCEEHGNTGCAYNLIPMMNFLWVATPFAWVIVVTIGWAFWSSRRLTTKLIIVTLVAGLLYSVAYQLHQRATREVENTHWSMQGEWIAFSCGAGYSSHVYLVRPDGSKLTRLTTDEIIAFWPSWSLDGEEIVFVKYRHLSRLRRGSNELIPLSVSDDQPGRDELYPAWSPDKQWIALVSWPTNEKSSLIRINVKDGAQETLVRNIEPRPVAWSPDGQWIAYHAAGEIRKSRVDGGETHTIVAVRVKFKYGKGLAWSPDSRRIVFVDDNIMYVINEDGSQKTRLTDLVAEASDPTWSPDGQWIVFTSYVERQGEELFKIRVDGSKLQQITEMPCPASYPDWIRMPGNE